MQIPHAIHMAKINPGMCKARNKRNLLVVKTTFKKNMRSKTNTKFYILKII